jgi:hypothetical protein
MGQHQQEIVAGSSALRRIILVLTVAALMAAMMAASAMPAFAGANKHASGQGGAASRQNDPGDAGDFYKDISHVRPGFVGNSAKIFAQFDDPGQNRDSSNCGLTTGIQFCTSN